MSPFAEKPPAIDFTALISDVARLLASDLRTRIRNDLDPLQTKSAPEPTSSEHDVSAHDALVGAVDDLGKASKALDGLKAYFDAAAKYATQQLKYHSKLKTYFEQTTDQLALRSELVAPIRRLPNEVLQLIFLEVHAQAREERRYNPVTARVCTFWRQLALATPVLWTSVNVDLKDDEERGLQAVARMKTQIERAKRRLVTVRFYMGPDEHRQRFFTSSRMDASTDVPSFLQRPSRLLMSRATAAVPRGNRHFKAAITTLLQYRDSIGELDIPRHEADLGGYLATMCATENIRFNNLHTLSLYEDQHFHHNFDAKSLLKACPNICRLRTYEAPDPQDIHWERIKEFKGLVQPGALTTFLSRAQTLEQAEISTCWHRITLNITLNITLSNRLTALTLDRSAARALAAIPRPPNLRCLALSAGCDSEPLTLLQSWGSDLEFLGLPCDMTAKDMKNLLPTVPNVRCLRLHGDRPTPPNLFNPLPKLTHIEIHTAVDNISRTPVRKLLSRPLNRTPRAKRLPLRSVTFLPPIRGIYDDRDERVEGFEGVWKDLYQELETLGIEVHEYRHQKTISTPALNTPFFQEHGFCV